MRLADLFPDEDYGFQLRLKAGAPSCFFAPSSPAILKERARWLAETPDRYSGLFPEGLATFDECIGLAATWSHSAKAEWTGAKEALHRLRGLAQVWEPDFLLLNRRENQGPFVMLGGAVCFPTAWDFAEKLGMPLSEIHSPVPGLNAALQSPIEGFLARVRLGSAWTRANWGFSATNELNQHPARNLPSLQGPLDKGKVWLRVEEQILCSLPKTGGFLFGIRLEHVSLSDLLEDDQVRVGLCRALRTMPEEVAVYKRLAGVRNDLLKLLQQT